MGKSNYILPSHKMSWDHVSADIFSSVSYRMCGILFGAAAHLISAVMVKQINPDIPAIFQTAGGLLVATPRFDMTRYLFDGMCPINLPLKASMSILSLASCGSVLVFALYYFVLKRLVGPQVALITLITPPPACRS